MESFISVKKIAVILLIVQTSNHVLGARRGYQETPIIEPHDHVIIDVNQDKEIECKSTKPITWLSENEHESVKKRYEVIENPEDLDPHIYRGYLEVTGATVEIVGQYLCAFTEAIENDAEYEFYELLIDHKATKFYIFVNDPENLLYDPPVPQVHGRQYEPFVIPCKPTMPNVKVELVNEEGETHYVGTYDSKVGFTVSFPNVEDSAYYDCRLQDDPDTFVQFEVTVFEQPVNITTTTVPSTNLFSLAPTNSLEEQLSERLIAHLSGDGTDKILAITAYLKKPLLLSDSNYFARDGATFTLRCEVDMETHVPYSVAFTLPNGDVVGDGHVNDFASVSNIEHEHENRRKAHINLTISNAEKSRDEGKYKCTIMDLHNNTSSNEEKVTFVDKVYVEFDGRNTKEIQSHEGKKTARYLINYVIYPKPRSFIWKNPRNEIIIENDHVTNRTKYDVTMKEGEIQFVVKKPSLDDFGKYTLTVDVDGEEYTQTVSLIVSAKPDCQINDVFVQTGESVDMACECKAYPPADITWSFQPCQDLTLWPECKKVKNLLQPKVEKYQMLEIGVDDEDQKLDFDQSSDFTQISNIRFTPSQPGTVKCKAKNSLGHTNVNGLIQISDLPEPFLILNANNDQFANGDEVKLECGALIYNYTDNLKWYKNGDEITEEQNWIKVTSEVKEFSYRKIIHFNPINKDDEAEYKCEVQARNGDISEKAFYITVHDAHPPIISSNFNQSEISQPFGGSITLECLIHEGLPIPTMSWYKDDVLLEVDENDTRVTLSNDHKTLGFSVLKPEDSGSYECRAVNREGTASRSIVLKVTTPIGHVSRAIIFGVIGIILLLVILSIYLCCKVRNKKLQIAELKAAGLANFEEGNVDSINPEISIDEQADLLPYDKKYEFPREKLKLGKQLGAGAFGIVVKATAEKIVHYEDESIVAVKMVKKQADNEVMKALVSELKIMIHLGQHLNVVNLLGAVTKNIAKRELMVIVEYCCFGNIQSFLVKHRPYFIDQVRNDRIDPMIRKNEMRWSKLSGYNSYNSPGLKYISVTFANDKITPKDSSYININGSYYINVSDGNQYTTQPNQGGPMGVVNPGAHMNSQGYVRHSGFHQVDSCNTEATVLSNMEPGEDSAMLSNNSEQPLWRTNYGMDYKGPARDVCTSDLICWAFQVARGMDYLASRKVLHGDLAARNILLCEDNIVKICDFGLARSMYKSDNYKKQGEAPLPFKWLSLEAISDHVFSTYSDVWAFGIVLWELFTLAKVPYPGMEANQELFYKLREGYRMEKPKYATEAIYDIMLSCWSAKPEARPLFNELERKLSSFLMDSVKDHYLDLNEPYLTANVNAYHQGTRDYLTSLSIPEEDAPKPPIAQEESFYINNSAPDVNETKPSYLAMSPKSGTVKYRPDSPTITKNLDTSPKNKKNINKNPELPEEIPMLLQMGNQNGLPAQEYSDEEPHNSYTEMSFTNGSKENHDEEDAPEYKNVFASNDNYVNVPATNKSITNPSYTSIKFNRVNERN